MTYSSVRMLIGLIILIFFIVKVVKDNGKKKGTAIAFMIVFYMILTSLSSLLPVENLFISFPSVESVFDYTDSGDIKTVVEGEESALVIYENEDSFSSIVLPKTDDGYKIGTFFSHSTLSKTTTLNAMITVDQASGTQDYYVEVSPTKNNFPVEVSDNRDSVFEIYISENETTTNLYHYVYVKDLDESYQIIIDGVPLSIDIK